METNLNNNLFGAFCGLGVCSMCVVLCHFMHTKFYDSGYDVATHILQHIYIYVNVE